MNVPLSILEFRDRAEMYFGEKTAIFDGEKKFTYGEFGKRTHRLANALRALGVRKGDRVSIICSNTHHMLEAYFGVIEAGAVLTPINIRLLPQNIAYIINHAASKVIFYHKDFTELVQKIKSDIPETRHFIVIEGEADNLATHEYEDLLNAASIEYQPQDFDENDIAELFYTSGTTGNPKGVALTHRNLHLHTLYAAIALKACDEDVVLHMIPLFHVNGLGQPHIFTLVGASHVLLRKYDPLMLLKLIHQYRVTHLIGVPTMHAGVVNCPEFDQYDVSSLKFVMAGGAPASSTLLHTMQKKVIKTAMAGYGLTETSPLICLAYPRKHLTDSEPPEMQFQRQTATGWAIPGIKIRVVDTHGNDVRPDGQQIGEIIVRSNVVMHGYYKDEKATQEAIRNGWFYTGDMATINDKRYFTIVDRSKDVIISGGENLSSLEIENVIFKHPAVLECVVVAAPDERWGEVPVALIVLKSGVTATADDILLHCRQHLPGFKIPKRIEFRENLLKGGTGKILKSEIREEFWKGHKKRVH